MHARNQLAAVALVLTSLFAAQAHAAPKDGKVTQGVAVLAKALDAVTDLSDEQKTDTKAILADAQAQLVALRDQAKSQDKADRKAHREQFAEILLNAKSQIEAALTDTQKPVFTKALQTARAEAQEKRREKQGGKKDKKSPDAGV